MKLDGKTTKAFGSLLLDLKTHGAIDIPADGESYKPAKKLEKLGVCTIEPIDYKSKQEKWQNSQYVRVILVTGASDRISF